MTQLFIFYCCPVKLFLPICVRGIAFNTTLFDLKSKNKIIIL